MKKILSLSLALMLASFSQHGIGKLPTYQNLFNTIPENADKTKAIQPYFTPIDIGECYHWDLQDNFQNETANAIAFLEFTHNLDYYLSWLKNNALLSASDKEHQQTKNSPFQFDIDDRKLLTHSTYDANDLIEEIKNNHGEKYKENWLYHIPFYFANHPYQANGQDLPYVQRYKDFYIGRVCRPNDCENYDIIFAWNPKTKELISQLGNRGLYFEFLSEKRPSHEALQALACQVILDKYQEMGNLILKDVSWY